MNENPNGKVNNPWDIFDAVPKESRKSDIADAVSRFSTSGKGVTFDPFASVQELADSFEDDDAFFPNETTPSRPSGKTSAPVKSTVAGIEVVGESGPSFGTQQEADIDIAQSIDDALNFGDTKDVPPVWMDKPETVVSGPAQHTSKTMANTRKRAIDEKRKVPHVFVDVENYVNGLPLTVCSFAISPKLTEEGEKHLKNRFKGFYEDFKKIDYKKNPKEYQEFLEKFFQFVFEKAASPAAGRQFIDIHLISAFGNPDNKALEVMVEGLTEHLDDYYESHKRSKDYMVISPNYKESGKNFRRFKTVVTRDDNGSPVRKKVKRKDSLRYIFIKNFGKVRFGAQHRVSENVSYISWAASLVNLAFNKYMRMSYDESFRNQKSNSTQALINALTKYVDLSNGMITDYGNNFRK